MSNSTVALAVEGIEKKIVRKRNRTQEGLEQIESRIANISDSDVVAVSDDRVLGKIKFEEKESLLPHTNLRAQETGSHSLQDEGNMSIEPRRLKQSTLVEYITDPSKLKKEISDRDIQIDDLRERLSHLELEALNREGQLRFIERELSVTKEKLDYFQETMRQEMIRTAKQRRSEARRIMHQQNYELGQFIMCPGTGEGKWVQGNVIRELVTQLEDLKKRRDDVEVLKKNAHITLKQLTRQDTEESSSGTELLLMQAQEEFQLRSSEHTALISAIGLIQQRKVDLENEKKAFRKEIIRINEEDASPFINIDSFGENDRYVLMSLLGKGGFSEVWKAFDLFEGRYVACKIHRVQPEWSSRTATDYIRHAQRELEIMRQVHHPHVTELYDVFQYKSSLFVSVMEYSCGMDLDTYLKRYQSIREADGRLIILQIVGALRYLASMESPIIHYDLKPANILLHSSNQSVFEIKITDFGLSKIIHQSSGPSGNPSIELTSQGTGTYWYQPPECFVIHSTPRICNKVDVWSVGIIFFQMLYGSRPFAEGQSQKDIWIKKLIITGASSGVEFPEKPKVSEGARELIRKCLKYNVAERYDIFQLSQDPYLYPRPLKKPIKLKSHPSECF